MESVIMGLFGLLKSIFDDRELGNQTIKAQVDCLHKLQRIYPNHDTHQYLIQIYLTRLKMRGVDISADCIQLKAATDTLMFSCLKSPDCARALGLWILYQENPQVIEKYPEFGAEFQRYVQLYQNTIDTDQFDNTYKVLNPTTSEELDTCECDKETEGPDLGTCLIADFSYSALIIYSLNFYDTVSSDLFNVYEDGVFSEGLEADYFELYYFIFSIPIIQFGLAWCKQQINDQEILERMQAYVNKVAHTIKERYFAILDETDKSILLQRLTQYEHPYTLIVSGYSKAALLDLASKNIFKSHRTVEFMGRLWKNMESKHAKFLQAYSAL